MIDYQTNVTVPALSLTGEMGERIEQFNWSATSLGPIGTWSPPLQYHLRTVTAAPFPMAFFWGPAYITFYNDGYKKILGNNGKHPTVLGKPFTEGFAETVKFVKPLFDSVYYEAKSFRFEDQLVPIHRNGKLEDVYWTFSYSPVFDEAGNVGGILVVCSETTEKVMKIMEKEEQFRTLAQHSPDIITRHDAHGKYLYASPAIEKMTGMPAELFIGKNHQELDLAAPLGGFFYEQLNVVYANRKPHSMEYYSPDKSTYLSTRFIPETDADGNIRSVISITSDITAGKKIGDELLYQKKLLETVTRNTSLGLIMLDDSRNCIYMNEAMEKMTGYRSDEMVGRNLHQVFHYNYPDGSSYPEEEFPLVCAQPQREPMKAEEFLIRKTGEFCPVAYAFSPIVVDGQAMGTVVEVRDITEQRKQEKVVRLAIESRDETLDLLESLLENAPVGLAFFDREHRYVRVNEALAEINGTPKDEHIGKAFAELLPRSADEVIPILERVAATGVAVLDVELAGYTPREPDVERFWIAGFYPIFNADGSDVEWVGLAVVEISDRKRAEQALKLSEVQLQLVADFMPQIVWTATANGYHDFYNERWYEFTGHTVEQSRGEGWSNVLHPDDYERTQAAWNHSLGTGDPYKVVYRMRHADGQYRWLLARAIPFRNGTGEIVRWYGTCTDVHEQRLASDQLEAVVAERTKELQDANDGLLHLNEELRQFTYITSHDLQEPLRKISLFTELVERSDYDTLSGPARLNFEKIRQSVARMRNSLHGLLEYSILDRKEAFTEIDLNKILEEVLLDLDMLIIEKGGVVRSETLPWLKAIPVQMKQMFSNLIINALKYSRVGVPPEIHITAKPYDTTVSPTALPLSMRTGNPYVEIVVTDNGIGFAPRHAEKIFGLFQRLHTRNSDTGSGIGLAICKKVALRHGGHIVAEGREGEGAGFRIFLPRG